MGSAMDGNVSKNFEKIRSFLKLFFSTKPSQQSALLQTITIEQAAGLAEVIYNLLNFEVPKKTKVLLKKRDKIIKKIISKKNQGKKKSILFQKYYKFFIEILLSVKQQLESLL